MPRVTNVTKKPGSVYRKSLEEDKLKRGVEEEIDLTEEEEEEVDDGEFDENGHVQKNVKTTRNAPNAQKTTGHVRMSWNDCTFEGFVKRDPDMAYTPEGKAYTKFSIAISQGRGKVPIYIQVTCWEDLAEKVAEEIIDGAHVKIMGRLNQYKAQTGVTYTGVTADYVRLTERNSK